MIFYESRSTHFLRNNVLVSFSNLWALDLARSCKSRQSFHISGGPTKIINLQFSRFEQLICNKEVIIDQ